MFTKTLKIIGLYILSIIVSSVLYENKIINDVVSFIVGSLGALYYLAIKHIILAFISDNVKDTSKVNRFLILLVTLLNKPESATDVSVAYQGNRLVKGSQSEFIDRFVIILFNIIILELLILISVIVSFKGNVPRVINIILILLILLSALVFVIVPFIYNNVKLFEKQKEVEEERERLEQETSGYDFSVDEGKRKQYLKNPKLIFVFFTFVIPILSLILIFILPQNLYYGNLLGIILGVGITSSILSLIITGLYLANSSGISKTQNIIYKDGKLIYEIYSGSIDFRTYRVSMIESISNYEISNRSITIYGDINDLYMDSNRKIINQKSSNHLSIVRVTKNEELLIEIIKKYKKNK